MYHHRSDYASPRNMYHDPQPCIVKTLHHLCHHILKTPASNLRPQTSSHLFTNSFQNILFSRRALAEPRVELDHLLQRPICLDVQPQPLRAHVPVNQFGAWWGRQAAAVRIEARFPYEMGDFVQGRRGNVHSRSGFAEAFDFR